MLVTLYKIGEVHFSFIGGGGGGAGGAEAPLNENLGGAQPPHVSVPKISVTRQKIGMAKCSG